MPGRPITAALLFLGLAAPAPAADLARGRAIALDGTIPGHPACSACHLANGAGLPMAGIPRLAGTDPAYLAQALAWFADGTRRNDVMHAYARTLTPTERTDVAAFYASLPAPPPAEPDPVPSPALVAQGKVLATTGRAADAIFPCAACHGPDLMGLAGLAPSLAAQSAPYLEGELDAWHAGHPRDPAGAPMVTEARALTPHDIAALAAYLSTKAPK